MRGTEQGAAARVFYYYRLIRQEFSLIDLYGGLL
jgi:hypothetical protein